MSSCVHLGYRKIPRWIAKQMTGIGWTDFSANAWFSCTRIEANAGARSGCEICYAAQFVEKRLGGSWGPGAPRTPSVGFVARMRRLNKLAADTGMPFSVFSLSLGDWLDAEVSTELRSVLIDTVEECTKLTWLLLTHRPHLATKFAPAAWRQSPPRNIWAGVTIDHPLHAYRWKHHADYWAHTGHAWISAEPLAASLDKVTFEGAATIVMGGASNTKDPTWEFNTDWVEEAVQRYGEYAVYFKQIGSWKDGQLVGKKAAGREVNGRTLDHTPWPRHREALAAAAAREATDNGRSKISRQL